MNVKFGGNTLNVGTFIQQVIRGELELRHGDTLYEVKMFHQFNLIGCFDNFCMYVIGHPDEFTVNNQELTVED